MLYDAALIAAGLAFLFRIGMVLFARALDPDNPISAIDIFPATLPRGIIIDFRVIASNAKLDGVIGIICVSYIVLIFIASISIFSYALIGLVK